MHAAAHWGLERPPFPASGDEPVFYAGLPQQEALARLRFLVHNQQRLALMLGQSGWGKSLVLTLFGEEATGNGWHVAEVNLLGLTVREFYWQLAVRLHANPRSTDDVVRLGRRVEDRFEQNQIQGEQIVLIFDDADHAGPDVLTQLARLIQMPRAKTGNLAVVLAADYAQSKRLGQRILDLVDLRIDLEPWDADDASGYLQLALVAAGAEQPIFTDAALAEIYRLTSGAPRLVNRLADYALVAGTSAADDTIGAEIVAAAFEAISGR